MRRSAATQKLLYVSDGGANAVKVYDYPSGKPVGALTGLSAPTGDCTNQSGDVWVVNSGASGLSEYAHGGKKPIAKLVDTAARNLLGCAVDSTTGNLAVTDLGGPSGGGNLVIYTDAKGTPSEYTASALEFAYFCAYDTNGDLFVDGLNSNGQFVLFELPRESSALESITLDQTVGFPGGVAWVDKQLAIGDQLYESKHESAIYEFAISGSSGKLTGTTPLSGSCDVIDFALYSGFVIAPDACQNTVGFYLYPTGGSPTKTLTGLQYPVGAAVSL